MKTINFKKVTGLVIALLMAITFMAQPLTVLADTYGEQDNGYTLAEDADYLPVEDDTDDEENQYPEEIVDPILAARIALFEMIYDAVPEVTRIIHLTEEAREIALYDFDYLAELMLATAPTRHMFERLFGLSLEDYLAGLRQMIYDMVPVPSFTAADFCAERWADEPTDPRKIAADYLYTLLVLFPIEIGGFGHFIPQPALMVEHTFFTVAYALQQEDPDPEATRQVLAELGINVEWAMATERQFSQFHYDILNTPSVLWFYDIDPSEFDFDVDFLETVGTMNVDNVTTYIIEPGQIAYMHIASFMNNLIMDSEVLFPFYEEIQDFEHLIIDIRGNGGGMVGYFPHLVVNMLIDEAIYFAYPEFFVASERTAALFENPLPLGGGYLYGIFPAAEFVQSQGMPHFNLNDLALLDYAIVWNAVFAPHDYSIPFGGDIWLLVDEGAASASVMAAKIAVNTGFATVVGTPTSRVSGVVYTHAALPNTGIIFRIDLGYTTDQYGRSVEEFGIIPHVANFPGMDALQTVIAVINGVDPTSPPEAAADESHIRVIDGVAHVWLRYVANLLGAEVQWDGANQAVIVTAADGHSFVVVVSSYGVVNYNGRVYVPVENVDDVLAALLG